MSVIRTPRPAVVAWLGYGGLLPFLGTALVCWLEPHHRSVWTEMLLGYGAVILSFVGALHWGFAMVHPDTSGRAMNGLYAWSVLPLPAWYLPLRLQLTVVACLSLATLYLLGQGMPQESLSA